MPGSSPTVYVVDDDPGVRESLRALLEAYGLNVEECRSGLEFLERFREQEAGCVVLDVHLPIVSGLETLSRLRGNLHSRVPVIMITGQADKGLQGQLMARGASAYVEKPFDALALVDVVSALARQGLGTIASR